MTTQLKQIADHYLLRGLFCREMGLWYGKTGMSLFFFLLSRHTGNHWYEEFAGELLDDLCVCFDEGGTMAKDVSLYSISSLPSKEEHIDDMTDTNYQKN